MDCLIFGGFGYIGSRLIDTLLIRGFNLTISTRSPKNYKFSQIQIIKNDRQINLEQLTELVGKYDLVIDCTGISGQMVSESKINDIINVNCLWPIKLAEACVLSKTKFVWFSSIHAKKVFFEDKNSFRKNIYGLSKLITENSIFEISNWEKFISVVRLGNIIGAPGKLFNNNSNLFPLEISRELINKRKATIKSDPNIRIAYISFEKLLNSNFLDNPGFYEIYGIRKNSLYSITKYIQKSFNKFNPTKTNISFKGNILNSSKEDICIELKKEIDMIIKYFMFK